LAFWIAAAGVSLLHSGLPLLLLLLPVCRLSPAALFLLVVGHSLFYFGEGSKLIIGDMRLAERNDLKWNCLALSSAKCCGQVHFFGMFDYVCACMF